MFAKNSKRVIVPYDAGVQGNSNNLYYDSDTGTMYYWNGTEYVAWGAGTETITTIETITDGFSYTNENGDVVEITQKIDDTDPNNQKIQTFVDGVKVFEFPLYTVNNDIQINNNGSEWDLTDDKITIVETNGDTQEIIFPYRVTMVVNANGSIDVKQNGVTVGTIPAPTPDTAYSKMLFVDPINGLDTNTGSDNSMFKTIAKALTVANGSGYRIVLGAGIYAENPTISLPNIDIVTVAGSDRGNTTIQGTVTFTHTSSSSGIQGIAMTNLLHSGAGALYVTDCQINTLLNKTSTGYIEITDTQLQGTSASTLSAGTGLIKDSLIKNMTISGASSGYTLKSNIIDADGTVTFTGGAFYNIQDNSGNIVTTSGNNMELGLIASGLSSALAKQYVTDFSNKLGMINPDNTNTNSVAVFWNSVTKRLEISPNFEPAFVVYVNDTTPSTATIFDLENPPATNDDSLKNQTNAIYIGTDGSTWTSNGTTYSTYVTPPATEWNLAGTLIDAGSNKNGAIYRRGFVGISNFDNFVPVAPIDITTQGQVNATAYISVDGVNNGNQVVVNLGTKRGTGTFGNGTNKGWQIGARSDAWNQGGTQEANLMFLSFWSGSGFTQLAKFAPNGNVCLGSSAYNFIPQFTLDVQGTARILTTPTITTATRMLVKDPITGQISEQLVPTGSAVNWVDVTTNPNATGNTTNLSSFTNNTVTGDKFFIGADGKAFLVEKGTIITSLKPQNQNVAGTWTDAQANSLTNVCDDVLLSNGERVKYGKYTFINHGFQVGANLYLSKSLAGTLTAVAPLDGDVSQAIAFVHDANTIEILVQQAYIEGSSASTTNSNLANTSAFVNRGGDVQLDNLKFRLAATGNASLQVSTVTGTASLSGSNEILQNTAFATTVVNITANTTPTYLNSAASFSVAGAVQRYTFIDQTSSKSYRVTLIVGSGYVNNQITIERI